MRTGRRRTRGCRYLLRLVVRGSCRPQYRGAVGDPGQPAGVELARHLHLAVAVVRPEEGATANGANDTGGGPSESRTRRHQSTSQSGSGADAELYAQAPPAIPDADVELGRTRVAAGGCSDNACPPWNRGDADCLARGCGAVHCQRRSGSPCPAATDVAAPPPDHHTQRRSCRPSPSDIGGDP